MSLWIPIASESLASDLEPRVFQMLLLYLGVPLLVNGLVVFVILVLLRRRGRQDKKP